MVSVHDLVKSLGSVDSSLATILEILPDMVFVFDGDERVLYLNTLAASALGGAPAEFIGRKQGELFAPEAGQRHSSHLQEVFRKGQVLITETHLELGLRPTWIEARLVPIKNAAGEVVAVAALVRDVTVAIQMRQSLSEREAYLRAMLDNFPYLVWLKDKDGRFLAVNRPFARACGRESPAQVVGLTDREIWPDELAAHYIADDREVMAHRQQKLVEETISDRGTQRCFETFKTPVLDDAGNLLGTTGFSRDITEKRRMDEEVRSSREGLRALAAHVESVREEERLRIAREIHDELGQALTCMGIDLAFLERNLPPEATQAASRAAALSTLVKETAQAVRRISSELRPSILDDLGLPAAVEWLANDFHSRTGLGCQVSTPEETRVAADRATVVFRMCQEALTNVARHANATAVAIDLTEDQEAVTLTVRDNGRGTTEESMRRPGSFGLLGMRERAGLLGGSVSVHSAPDQGTTVTVRVPLSDRARDRSS